MKAGDRVGAILSGSPEGVRFLGFGVYAGDEVPPREINPWLNTGNPNPKIVLDSGEIVWGCECWWGPEERIKKELEGHTIVPTSITEHRKQYQENPSVSGEATH